MHAVLSIYLFFFFFKQKTAYEMRISDWSSDVCSSDLLRKPPSREETSTIETLIASMWDLGIEPGHSVRTLEDCRRESANDITVDTALMAARWLVGSKALLQELHELMREQLDAQTFLQAKRDRKSKRLNSWHYCAPRLPSSPYNTK